MTKGWEVAWCGMVERGQSLEFVPWDYIMMTFVYDLT